MLWTLIIVLLSATYKLASSHETGVSSLTNTRDTSADATYLSVAYYVNWAIYDRKFNPQELPADKLTHVLYAFANISPTTGEVYLSDIWADTEIPFPGDSSGETGTNLYGCFKQLYLLKKANRNLKVLLSIGGQTYSENFAGAASTESGRSAFASTALSLVSNLGLDGLDIDWEYPQNDTEATNMVLLLQTVRETLDAYGNSLNPPYKFTLTVACPAGSSYYQTLHLADMAPYIDFWNLMAFDYAGSWSAVAANQANLFPSTSDPASTPFCTKDTVNYYIGKGIKASKIILGMPIYGRSFAATDGLGQPFKDVGQGTWQAGVYDFKALPSRGATESYDSVTGSSYSYDITSKELVSYDDVPVAKQKAAFIQYMGLGGAMWWESSADKEGNDSLIQNVAAVLGGVDGSGLEDCTNRLLYPDSTYDNLRAGMPGSGFASATPSSPFPGGSSASGPSTLTRSTSTIHTTIVSTIIGCASSIEDCPATTLTTVTVPVSTTICPVTETGTGSSQRNSVSASSAYEQTSLVTKSTTTINIDVISSSTTRISEVDSTATSITSSQPPQGSITSTLIVPGKDGVPGCAYVLASALGAGALCSSDYCNCGGTVAPLLTSSISGTLTTNCNYQTQPIANSCPTTATENVSVTWVTIIATPPLVTVTSVVIVPYPGSK